MRLRNNPKADEILKNSEFVINGSSEKYFDNNNPIHLEIGMGKGDFIVQNAIKNPHINYIGIEKFSTVLIKALDKVEKNNLTNVKLMNVDANDLLDYFKQHSIDVIYLNFSDPWPKKRHYKRRLTYKSFLEIYEQLLNTDGYLQFKTDNQLLFESSLISMNNYGCIFEEISLDLHNSPLDKDNIKTEYERKFSGLGFRINLIRIKFKKK